MNFFRLNCYIFVIVNIELQHHERDNHQYCRLRRGIVYGVRVSATGLSHHPYTGYRRNRRANIPSARTRKCVLRNPGFTAEQLAAGHNQQHHDGIVGDSVRYKDKQ